MIVQTIVTAIASIIAIPLIILNIFGGIVAGIWLAIAGDWTAFLVGIGFIFLGTLIASILLLPSLLVGMIAMFFYKKKSALGVGACVFVSQALIYSIILGLSYAVFQFMAATATHSPDLIVLVWSYAVAVAPWTYMASKEKDNDSTMFSLFMSQAGLLAVIIMAAFFGARLEDAFGLVSALAVIPITFTTITSYAALYNSGEYLIINGPDADSKYTRDELTMFVVAMMHVAAADGTLHQSEIDHVRRVFREITDERISKQFVRRIYDALRRGDLDYDALIDEAATTVSSDMKDILVRSAYRLSTSDGELHADERKIIVDMARRLGLNRERTAQLIGR